jgi:hypothetical protein
VVGKPNRLKCEQEEDTVGFMALQDEQKKAQGEEDGVAQWVQVVGVVAVVAVVAVRVVSINDVRILVARMGTVC